MKNLIQELQWRGMIQDITPGTEEALMKEKTAGYIGFDPTADSLHIGSLVPILLLVHLQRAGHKAVALVGGATGMVGDPSGKAAERNLLSEDALATNVAGIQKQLDRFLHFDAANPDAPELVNNYDWFKNFSFLNFIRDVGKHISVNYMMRKESVRKRLEGETGMSFTEFSYQLIQGYDFLHLFQHNGCKMQMGGSDQWGNITTGTELIRRMTGEEAYAFTCPLITRADGGKFGKSEGGNIWLDAEKTSPYQFYQFWLNATDADARKWISIFTFLSQEEIFELIKQHDEAPSQRMLQKKLADEVTRFVHGEEALQKAVETTQLLFSGQQKAADEMSLEELENLEGIQHMGFSKSLMETHPEAVAFLTEAGIFPSRGEARKMIMNGGVSINRIKLETPQSAISADLLLHQQYLLVQRGKKNYYLLKAE